MYFLNLCFIKSVFLLIWALYINILHISLGYNCQSYIYVALYMQLKGQYPGILHCICPELPLKMTFILNVSNAEMAGVCERE